MINKMDEKLKKLKEIAYKVDEIKKLYKKSGNVNELEKEMIPIRQSLDALNPKLPPRALPSITLTLSSVFEKPETAAMAAGQINKTI